MMIKQEFEDLEHLYSVLTERIQEIVNKLAKEIDDGYLIECATRYNPEKARIELDKDGITVWSNDLNEEIIAGFYYEPNGLDDTPIECLYDNDCLNNYIKKLKEYYDKRKKENDNYEYNRYLELKAKFEDKTE